MNSGLLKTSFHPSFHRKSLSFKYVKTRLEERRAMFLVMVSISFRSSLMLSNSKLIPEFISVFRESTKNLYPLFVGTLPAEVWGCFKYPISVSLFISPLIVAGQKSSLLFSSKSSELTGFALFIYNLTSSFSMFFCLSVIIGISILYLALKPVKC